MKFTLTASAIFSVLLLSPAVFAQNNTGKEILIEADNSGRVIIADRADKILQKVQSPEAIVTERKNVSTFPGGCNDLILQDNANENLGVNFTLADFSVFSVTYGACEEVTTMCVHRDAGVSANEAAEAFGKFPARVRAVIGELVFTPSNGSNFDLSYIHTRIRGGANLGTMALAFANVLDFNLLFHAIPELLNDNRLFLDAFNQSKTFTDSTAAESPRIAFTQMYLTALVEAVAGTDGLAALFGGKKFDGINEQLTVVKTLLDVALNYEPECFPKSDPPPKEVPIVPAASANSTTSTDASGVAPGPANNRRRFTPRWTPSRQAPRRLSRK